MDLNNAFEFKQLDSANYLGHIHSLSNQLLHAWETGLQYPLNITDTPRLVIICGMGGSAIGGELAAAYARKAGCSPVIVLREYDLPAWALNPDTLVVASSYSGNTEETLSAFHQAMDAGCKLVALTRGGELARLARQLGAPVWKIEHESQPRAAVANSFGLLMALFHRLGLIPNPQAEILKAVERMRTMQKQLDVESPLKENPAKRQAGQMYGRMVCFIGSDLMAPVARRWAGQVNELAKAWAQFLELPEADHNALTGTVFPAERLTDLAVVFLQSPGDHPRNILRSELTRELFMMQGVNTDRYIAPGDGLLEQMWSAILFGDYVAYYLAMLYNVDPTPIPPIEQLKQAMKD